MCYLKDDGKCKLPQVCLLHKTYDDAFFLRDQNEGRKQYLNLVQSLDELGGYIRKKQGFFYSIVYFGIN